MNSERKKLNHLPALVCFFLRFDTLKNTGAVCRYLLASSQMEIYYQISIGCFQTRTVIRQKAFEFLSLYGYKKRCWRTVIHVLSKRRILVPLKINQDCWERFKKQNQKKPDEFFKAIIIDKQKSPSLVRKHSSPDSAVYTS